MSRGGAFWLATVVVLVALGYLASGFYSVAPDERGVVRWLGRVPADAPAVTPGINYVLPWPLGRVDRPKTTEVRRLYVGLTPEARQRISAGDVEAMRVSPASDMLTGDVNILKVTLVVSYQVDDAAEYVFGASDPDRLVLTTARGVLIEQLSGLAVDAALTRGKTKLEQDIERATQARLDGYGCGVLLVSANLETIEPPRAIIAAFQDVVSAKKDGERAVDRAIAESNRVLPRARGDAATVLSESAAYRERRLGEARGAIARFESLLVEYRRNPAIFRERLLLETLERVLPNVRTYIWDQRPGEAKTNVRILELQGG